MFKRTATAIIKEALEISPAVLISGARQVGKSTLSLQLDMEYRVFDNLTDRESALNDPIGYINSLPKPVCIDEIQKVPQVLESIKLAIDAHRINGSFLLTGSANILDMKKTKDSLAGRIIEISLWPLSQKELHQKPDENVIDLLFKTNLSALKIAKIEQEKIYQAIIDGGYPEIQKINSPRGKALWFDSYISTYVERDIRDIGELRDIASFIRFYNIITPRSSGLLNKSDLANDANISEATANNYLTMLDMIYQISQLQPYSSNISKRFIKTPKIFMNDTGVLSHILNITTPQELLSSSKKGDIIETFVYSELQKHISYSSTMPKLYHYRTNDKKEIDFIIEKGEKIVAVEVKSSQSISMDAFKHIADFQNKTKNKEVLGIVLYMGKDVIPFGDDTHQRYAVPMGIFF
jgi:predicted AAA+ superfamily ATPase